MRFAQLIGMTAIFMLFCCVAYVNAEPTHLHPPEKPHLETVEETAAKAQALAVI